jgi:hypothetical protein
MWILAVSCFVLCIAVLHIVIHVFYLMNDVMLVISE